MKNSILLILIILTLNLKANGQCDEEYINSLLYSDNPTDRAYGSQIISNCNLTDFSTILLDRFLQESFLVPAKSYVSTLEALRGDEAYEVAVSFIQNIENYTYDEEFEDILDAKVVANRSLVKENNFNYFNFVTDIVTRDRPNLNLNTIQCLINTILNNNQYVEYSKNELYNSLSNSNNYLSRSMIISGLLSCDNQNFLNYIRSHSTIEPDIQIRNQFYDILIENRSDNDKEILYNQELNDGDKVNRAYLANRILSDFGLPIDLYSVKSNLQNETNTDVIKIINYLITNFIPPRPQMNTREYFRGYLINEIITPLLGYEWISPSISYDYAGAVQNLLEIMDSSQPFDYEQFCNLLTKEIIPQIDKDYETNELTLEGYKFLHYNFIYLLDQFNEEFQQNCSM